MEQKVNLHPCRHCAGEAKLCQWKDTENPNATWIECTVCHIMTDSFHDPDPLKAAHAAAKVWNASPAPNDRDDRNGNWLDKWGCCRVCDGEIPYGHDENCDLYKMECEIRMLKEQIRVGDVAFQHLFEEHEKTKKHES